MKNPTFAALVSCFMALLLLPSTRAATCQLETVRESARQSLMGGWREHPINETNIFKLAETASAEARTASSGSAPLTRPQHVIEAFKQIVNGVNYCVRFSAVGECENYHCKSYECVTKGHQPLGSTEISVDGVECNPIEACDIDSTRKSSETPMPGGWFTESIEDERVQHLHEKAALLGTVEKGSIVEAYSQTVAGQKFCILFNAKTSGNCGDNCKELTCVAGGFDPLPHDVATFGLMTQIGINCVPRDSSGLLRASLSNNEAASRHPAAVLMAVLAAFVAAIFG